MTQRKPGDPLAEMENDLIILEERFEDCLNEQEIVFTLRGQSYPDTSSEEVKDAKKTLKDFEDAILCAQGILSWPIIYSTETIPS